MTYPDWKIWLLITLLGLGTFLIRYSFLGLVGGRKLPDWLLRHLRYTPVAILPGLVAPQVLWPAATHGVTDPARLVAGCVALIVGYWSKNMLATIFAGVSALYGMQFLLG